MSLPACPFYEHHRWVERVADQDSYVRYCTRCGLVVEGPWDQPTRVYVRKWARAKKRQPKIAQPKIAQSPSLGRRALVVRLEARDGEGCFYCHQELTWTVPRGPRSATVDHFVPRAKGGSNRFENLRAACYECNHLKGDLTVEEFQCRRLHGKHWRTRAGLNRVEPIHQSA